MEVHFLKTEGKEDLRFFIFVAIEVQGRDLNL